MDRLRLRALGKQRDTMPRLSEEGLT